MNDNRKPSIIFLEKVKAIVYKILEKEKVLQGEWRYGKVESIVDSRTIKCFIDGGDVAVTVRCNPDATFAVDDQIWVIYPNGNQYSKFALCKR